MEKQRNVRIVAMIFLVISLITLSIAFAMLSKKLNITGEAKLDPAKWGIKFVDNTLIKSSETTDTVTFISEPKITEATTISDMNFKLNIPGDKVVYEVNILNESNINAKVEVNDPMQGITDDDIKKVISFNLKYKDSKENVNGSVLQANTEMTLVITFYYSREEITKEILDRLNSKYPKGFNVLTDSIKLNFTQSDEVANITTKRKLIFPQVSGKLGDNVFANYSNGVINITGSGDMYENSNNSKYKDFCSFAIGNSDTEYDYYCSITEELGQFAAKTLIDNSEISFNNENIKYIFGNLLGGFMGGLKYGDGGMPSSSDELKETLKSDDFAATYGVIKESEIDNILNWCDAVPTLKEITIQNGITSMRTNSLSNISVSEITIPSSVVRFGYIRSNAEKESPYYIENIFQAYTNIEKLIFEEGITELYLGRMESDSVVINEIVLPNSLKAIGTGSFSNISGLTTLTIPSSVTKIGCSQSENTDNWDATTISGSSLKKIINKSGNSFDWQGILTGVNSGILSETGAFTVNGKEIIVSKE